MSLSLCDLSLTRTRCYATLYDEGNCTLYQVLFMMRKVNSNRCRSLICYSAAILLKEMSSDDNKSDSVSISTGTVFKPKSSSTATLSIR